MDNNIISTGIEGLDNLIQGGFIRNRAIILRGSAGTGKSTLAMQFLVNGARKFDEPGVLLTTEYDVNDMIIDMENFNWPIRDLIKNNQLKIITPPGGFEQSTELEIDEIINMLHKQVSSTKAKRIVIDSLNSLEVMLKKDQNLRRELLRFITLLRELDCTTLLISESYDNEISEVYKYMAHGVIQLYNNKVGSNRIRAIEVIKMRGVNHSTLTHSMNLVPNQGIVVHPHEIDLS
ncbi:MAG: RAD55 family ATPase [Candidatus Kariarchaeaceae archaeon]|jgi:circadian clock protein KaiC